MHNATLADSELVVTVAEGNRGQGYAFPKYDCGAIQRGVIFPTRQSRKRDVCFLIDTSGSVIGRANQASLLATQLFLISQHQNINSLVIACVNVSWWRWHEF